ncbi:TAXI family TRAP transporter solute-binding subunit [Methylobacterium sp. E-005]|uniref:TAXI family TRAP transporter solute-binding subunit n=1 Tax=Methylobacterium sp. E-005 TaxID=2836549 RepID=UPI001FBAA9C8|nr:TAXI family TRAP transporter solute-binding subunit [Methylobacterium sp. E-005]MCJ2089728.1 TAXI family TRAP transporter solute-binding subunit [Methylobacterium sp. E-005]
MSGMLLGALGLLAPRSVRSEEPVRAVLATATPGGGFPAFGAAFAGTIRQADPALVIELRASAGSVENLRLLQAGRVDLGLVQGEYAYPAFASAEGVTVLAPMYPTPGLFVVPMESAIRSVADLRGRSVVLGTHQSGLTVMARAVLRASGLDPARDIRPVLLDRAGDGPTLVRDGQADALWGGGLDWPGFIAMARAPGGARFFGPSEAGIAQLAQPGGAMKRLTVPAGSFPGQSAPIETVGSWSFVLARPGFDGETADRIVRALGRNGTAPTNPKNLIGLVPMDRINAATARALRAGGLIQP